MRPSPHGLSSPAPFMPLLSSPAQWSAEFLEVHEAACAAGEPLLTGAGVAYLRERLLAATVPHALPANATQRPRASQSKAPLPRWDAEGRRLWLGGRLLKEFRQPARNQTALLSVFQEQGWAAHIDDPLRLAEGEGEEDAKRRLHDTVKNLNRGLPPGAIRFRGDGTGQGVGWEYAAPEAGKDRAAVRAS